MVVPTPDKSHLSRTPSWHPPISPGPGDLVHQAFLYPGLGFLVGPRKPGLARPAGVPVSHLEQGISAGVPGEVAPYRLPSGWVPPITLETWDTLLYCYIGN